MQSLNYLTKDNIPEHITMEWELLDIIISNLFDPYFYYNNNYYIETTSQELKFIYNCHFSEKYIDCDSFYDLIENEEDIDDNYIDYIIDYYKTINRFDKKYGKNGILNLLIHREGVIIKDENFGENDILWHIYPSKFLNGVCKSYEEDIQML